MPWVGISESGIPFTFTPGVGGVTMTDSVVSAADAVDAGFVLQFSPELETALPMRVTVQSYNASSVSGAVGGASFTFNDNGVPSQIINAEAEADPQSAFSPSPIEDTLTSSLTYQAAFGSEWGSTESYAFLIEVDAVPPVSYNCECDDDYPRSTLAEMRRRLLVRLGYSAQADNPPPGMADLLDDFIRNAQEMLFRRYKIFRLERFFTWNLEPGVRFYDLEANRDVCTKKLDPRMVTWVGISQGDDSWQPIGCGIDPAWYTSNRSGMPERYEIRQCIELWPYPADDTWQLRVKGHFGLLPLVADDDNTTVDSEAIFLLALANAKAHEGQGDAKNYIDQLNVYIGDLISGSHHTRRYLPGSRAIPNRPMPRPKVPFT